MERKWMNKTLLALSIQMVFGVAYAAEEPQLGEYETTAEQQTVSEYSRIRLQIQVLKRKSVLSGND